MKLSLALGIGLAVIAVLALGSMFESANQPASATPVTHPVVNGESSPAAAGTPSPQGPFAVYVPPAVTVPPPNAPVQPPAASQAPPSGQDGGDGD